MTVGLLLTVIAAFGFGCGLGALYHRSKTRKAKQ